MCVLVDHTVHNFLRHSLELYEEIKSVSLMLRIKDATVLVVMSYNIRGCHWILVVMDMVE